MNIFIVTKNFERPIHIENIPVPLKSLSSKECAVCHLEIYNEWRTSIHSQAWTEPYFQADFRFDSSQQICKNCHIPLENQQEELVLGFRDKEKFKPILKPNPLFDPDLQKEGVTCAVCHVRDGYILGPRGGTGAPHPVKIMRDSNQICAKCKAVDGDRWDTFFRFPPCGAIAEIKASGKNEPWNCVQCHMPSVRRSIVSGGEVRLSRRHWWRGGHDREMVKSALKVELLKMSPAGSKQNRYTLTLTNTGAAHYLPTGTPDRFLNVIIRVLDQSGRILREENHVLKRTVMWRPFIIDLWDTRLPRWKPRTIPIVIPSTEGAHGTIEAIVEYHLLDEKRRKRIDYNNTSPISYEIYRERIAY